MSTVADSPQLVIAMRLLDHLKLCGFEFRRAASGEDGPLVGHRVSGDWVDTIHIEGFSRDCFAWRKPTCSLIVADSGLVERRAHGSALTVLNDVLTWEKERESHGVEEKNETMGGARRQRSRSTKDGRPS